MRTTLTIDDDLMHQVRELAARQGLTLGQVVAGLLHRGLASDAPVTLEEGVPVFRRRPGLPTITLAAIREAELEE